MYLTGKGTERSLLRAFENFERSANLGDHWGLNNLGGMYEMGWGVAKDTRRALEFYGRAVEAGNKPAQDNFARLSAIVEGRPLPPATVATTQIKPAAAPAGTLQQATPPTVFTPDSETHQE
jgi:hypothetical protein